MPLVMLLYHRQILGPVCCCVAATDILLGYHSEEGWTAAIHLLTKHYGIEVEVRKCCVPFTFMPACASIKHMKRQQTTNPALAGIMIGCAFCAWRAVLCLAPETGA